MDLLEEYMKRGNLEKVRVILKNENFKFDDQRKDYYLLKISFLHKQKDIAKLFIQHDFRVNDDSDCSMTPLHLAVKLGWNDVAKLLLDKGASVSVEEHVQRLTPIQMSFLMKKYELTDLLLHFDECKKKYYTYKLTHLHVASARNCVNSVKRYLLLKSELNCHVDSDFIFWRGYTPLHFAVEFQCTETVELLLRYGADITRQDKNGNTPLHIAVGMMDESLIDLLLSEYKYTNKNPKNIANCSHFHIACTRNNPDIVYGFLQCNIDTNEKVSGSLLTKGEEFMQKSALSLAITYQCTEVVKLLLSYDTPFRWYLDILKDAYSTKNTEIINLILSLKKINWLKTKKNTINQAPLHQACMQNNYDKVKELIKSGVPVNEHLPLDAPRWPGATALHIAADIELYDSKYEEKAAPIMKLLLKNGADPTAIDARGKTPVHIAFEYECNNIVQLLLSKHQKWQLHAKSKDNLSHFHIACASSDANIVKRFLNAGVDVNAVVHTDSVLHPGFTPLHMAVTQFYFDYFKMIPDILKNLLAHGADITIKNTAGQTAYDLLLQNKFRRCYLWFVCSSDAIFEPIIDHKESIAWFNSRGFTHLHVAILTGNEIMIKQYCTENNLINKTIDSNSEYFPGYTPLHFAVECEDYGIVRYLLDHGANPTLRDAKGKTPLHKINFDMKLNLIENREVVDSRLFVLDENPFDSDGKSHFHLACEMGYVEIVRSFLDRGVIDPNLKTRLSANGRDGMESGLHLATSYIAQNAVIQLLLERGANVNIRDSYDKTFIHTNSIDETTIKLFLKYGGDIHARDYEGDTILYVVWDVENDHSSIFNIAFKAGVDINVERYDGETVLSEMCKIYDLYDELPEMYSILRHVLRLIEAGCYLHETYKPMLKGKFAQLMASPKLGKVAYRKKCKMELKHMALVPVYKNTTLRDVLPMRNACWLKMLAANKKFQSLATSPALDKKYPIYGYLVKLQYQRGLKRRRLIKDAAPLLTDIIDYRLSDDVEIILSYLSNEEIEYMLEVENIE